MIDLALLPQITRFDVEDMMTDLFFHFDKSTKRKAELEIHLNRYIHVFNLLACLYSQVLTHRSRINLSWSGFTPPLNPFPNMMIIAHFAALSFGKSSSMLAQDGLAWSYLSVGIYSSTVL